MDLLFSNNHKLPKKRLNYVKSKNFIKFLPPATKLGQGYNFTGVCDFIHGGGVPGPGGAWSGGSVPGACLVWGVCSKGGAWWRPPGRATATGGTHPTGMHSCWLIFFLIQGYLTVS